MSELVTAKTFEEFVLTYTGRELAYHERYGTYGLAFARAAWDAAMASARPRKERAKLERGIKSQ